MSLDVKEIETKIKDGTITKEELVHFVQAFIDTASDLKDSTKSFNQSIIDKKNKE